ncbi:hypothetical protein TOPH_01162 [Tolypocladium ophioglossoides CBS 100239]|uniref:Life-span regulatory factor domain-containing protein n=1 Tax=Tolypocladium ophioglossoides (strain CBS 100239) TaxID=1163406 RepID=A0A0L0NL44_TOLOC|nr:hypothetical protein TOPH_01162 [Tolypocladium ophioglossoides CBS 100239]
MAFDLWTHQFCLACDKQVQSDGAAYCSEACRLADHEKTSTPSSQASSPGFSPPGYGYPWSATTTSPPLRSTRSKFYLSPPYDFNNPQPYGTAPTQTCFSKYAASIGEQSTASNSVPNLTPSSSHSSLCSTQSTSSLTDATHLSDKSRQELKAYAISFEHVRLQRRRSY